MPAHTKSKLQTVLEESSSAAVKNPSVTTAVKSMASVLLGPRGKTPLESMLTMQHYQLWGFILIVVGIIYIVWLMQKKLDSIEKQYKEQFVLLHRLFKSHQDLQVEVRKKPVHTTTVQQQPTAAPIAVPSANTVSLEMEDEDDLHFEEEQARDEDDEQEDEQDDGQGGEEEVEEESVGSNKDLDYEEYE